MDGNAKEAVSAKGEVQIPRRAPTRLTDHVRNHLAAEADGGGRSFPVNGVSVTGVLIVNVEAVVQDHGRFRSTSGFGEGTTWDRVLLHEPGHLVAGLRLLGKHAGCLAPPSAPRRDDS